MILICDEKISLEDVKKMTVNDWLMVLEIREEQKKRIEELNAKHGSR